jgi:hypothetical protein
VCPSPAHAGGGTSIWTMEGSMISCQSRTHARSPVRLVPRARIRGMAGETAVSDRTPIEHMVEEPSLLLLGLTTVGWRLRYVENFSHPMQHNTSMIHLTKKRHSITFQMPSFCPGPGLNTILTNTEAKRLASGVLAPLTGMRSVKSEQLAPLDKLLGLHARYFSSRSLKSGQPGTKRPKKIL